MPYISINNFKFGLDSRRSELSSVQGTLVQALNGHITEGGEFEKRKAFTKLNNAGRPSNTFGLEVTSTGLVVFGSAAPSGSAVAGTTLYNISGYASVYYQQLIHPAVVLGASYDATKHNLTTLLCSTSFGGNTWAAATFSDGTSYAYYNGSPIRGFFNGIVLSAYNSLQQIATQLSTFIATITGFSVGAVTASGGNYYFDMWSVAGLAYTLTINVPGKGTNGGSGAVSAKNISTFLAGLTGAPSTTSFTVTGGSFSNNASITSIKVFDQVSSSWIEVLGATVSMQSSDTFSTFANSLAGQIDTFSSGLHVSAVTTNNTVVLSFDVSLGAAPNGDNLRISTSGDCCVDNTVAEFAANTSPSGDNITSIQMPTQTNLVSGSPNYSVGGSYTLTGFTIGQRYYWKQGANDTNLSMSGLSGSPLTTSQTFVATATSATLNGTASQPVTAIVLTYTEVLGATITAGGTVTAWVVALAAQVRTYCLAHSLNYTAFANGTQLALSRSFVDTSLPFGGQAVLTTNSAVIQDGAATTIGTSSSSTFRAQVTPTIIALDLVASGNRTVNSSQVSVSLSGNGVAPFSYSWQLIYGGTAVNSTGIILNKPNDPQQASTISFTGLGGSLSTTAEALVTVTDSIGQTATAFVNVVLFGTS